MSHLETGREDFTDVRIDLERQPPFQRRVLDALRTIPAGSTATYEDVARRIGRPGTARAVGNACASNPAIVLIPCHRVVRGDGAIGAFSGEGGAATKRRLLEIEGTLRRASPIQQRTLAGAVVGDRPDR
ncbi:MAG: methylated-DNA--[protein]-cysteine S-methyltransferase [Thermoplasmatota archaeon]